MLSIMDVDKEAHLSSSICGYHVNNAIRSATVTEVAVCKEVENAMAMQICNFGPMMFRCSGVFTSSGGWNIMQHVFIT